MLNIRVRSNTVSPSLARELKKVRDKTYLHRAMSDALAETTKGAFNNSALRPTPWPDKADGSTATLRLDNLLARSPRTSSATPRKAILGSDRPYASVHQHGSKRKNIPARRYFPFIGKKPTALAIKRGQEALRVKLGIRR